MKKKRKHRKQNPVKYITETRKNARDDVHDGVRFRKGKIRTDIL